MPVQFEDNRMAVKAALEKAALTFLEEAAGELESQTARNQTRVDTGDTKGKWTHIVDEGKLEATIGNPLENAIWEEFGENPVPNQNRAISVKAKLRKSYLH